MQDGATIATDRPVNTRSSLTNDPRRLSAEADMRSADGRLFADLYDAVAGEFGSDADPTRLREIATLRFASEKALLVGNWEDVVRLANAIEKKERSLRARRRALAAAPSPSVRHKLPSRYGGPP